MIISTDSEERGLMNTSVQDRNRIWSRFLLTISCNPVQLLQAFLPHSSQTSQHLLVRLLMANRNLGQETHQHQSRGGWQPVRAQYLRQLKSILPLIQILVAPCQNVLDALWFGTCFLPQGKTGRHSLDSHCFFHIATYLCTHTPTGQLISKFDLWSQQALNKSCSNSVSSNLPTC